VLRCRGQGREIDFVLEHVDDVPSACRYDAEQASVESVATAGGTSLSRPRFGSVSSLRPEQGTL
jgi:hypothetical protein